MASRREDDESEQQKWTDTLIYIIAITITWSWYSLLKTELNLEPNQTYKIKHHHAPRKLQWERSDNHSLSSYVVETYVYIHPILDAKANSHWSSEPRKRCNKNKNTWVALLGSFSVNDNTRQPIKYIEKTTTATETRYILVFNSLSRLDHHQHRSRRV